MLQANPNLTPNLIKAILQYTARSKPDVHPLKQGAGILNAAGAVTLARFYANSKPGDALPIDPSWSQHIIWGNRLVSGGFLDPTANAWMPGVQWGWAYAQEGGPPIVWGVACEGPCFNIVWGTSEGFWDPFRPCEEGCFNIVWGTSEGWWDPFGSCQEGCFNIVWGTSEGFWDPFKPCEEGCFNIVWGTSEGWWDLSRPCEEGCFNIVWGTSEGFWEPLFNIVWGTSDKENLIWPIYQPVSLRGRQ
jgi:hypothetical protein